jgi:hypothetical protein
MSQIDVKLAQGESFGGRAGRCEAEERPAVEPQGPTLVAKQVRHLRSRVFSLVEKRERLPHPLFWSVFCGEVAELRKRKEKQRLERALWLSGAGS